MGTILLMGAGLQTTVTGPTYDPDAQLFFNAQSGAGVTLTTTQKDAVNQWVVDAKAIGIWTKFKAVYPMVGGTATAHKFNLINPADTNAAFRLVFNGGWVHSSTGATPNGTNGWANTFCLPSNMALNSIHLSHYSRSNNAVGVDVSCAGQTANAYCELAIKFNASGGWVKLNTIPNAVAQTSVDARGHFIGNRTASTVSKFIRNGVNLNTYTVASNTNPPVNLAIGANLYLNASNVLQVFSYSNKECAFASIGDGLTDLESQLFYQITEKYQVALSRNINTTQSFYYNSAYNNETNAFLFSTQITNTTIQTATNTLVSDLKTAGIYTKMKALYPMVGGTATTHKYNLINPQDTNAAFRLSFVGGWTHSANGALPNGTNAYANTFLNASTALTPNSQHISYYSRTLSVGAQIEMGAFTGPTDKLLSIRAAFNYASGSVSSVINFTTTTDARGFWLGTRRADNDREVYRNGVTQATSVVNDSNTYPNIPIYIGARNLQGTGIDAPSSKECAFSSIGDGLTDAEALALYNAVQTFNTTLNRQI